MLSCTRDILNYARLSKAGCSRSFFLIILIIIIIIIIIIIVVAVLL